MLGTEAGPDTNPTGAIMKKLYLAILVLVATTIRCYASEPMTIERDLQRLTDKDSIVYVVRVAAPMAFLRYEEYLKENSSLKKEQIKRRWCKLKEELKSQFIVLRDLKGKTFFEGQLAEFSAVDPNFDFMGIGRGYIVYLSNRGQNKYEYEPYDVVDVAKIPSSDIEEVFSMVPRKLTQYLIENNYFGNSDSPVEPKPR